MSPQQLPTLRELDSRTSEGLQVRLLWREDDGQLFVSVCDARTEDSFMIEVPRGKRPLEVFRHPYAYSDARQRVPRPAPIVRAAET